jgi:hypothetical protein
MRQCIERAFGIMTQRWGILWRPIRCNFKKWPLLLTVIAKLHNFCIDKKIPIYRHRFYRDEQYDDEPAVILSDNGDGLAEEVSLETINVRNRSKRRSNFTKDLEDKGIRRPRHAAMNSRADI